jgi:hypothetical protein
VTLRGIAVHASLAFMMVNKHLLAVVLAVSALGSAASAVAAPMLGLPPTAHLEHEHGGFGAGMFAHRNFNRYQQYGYYGGYSYGSPYQLEAAQPAPTPIVEAPAAAPATPYNSNKVCPVIWRWSARAGQAVRSWSYCNN